MHKKFEINLTKTKGGRQPQRKVVIHNSKSDLPLKIKLFSLDDLLTCTLPSYFTMNDTVLYFKQNIIKLMYISKYVTEVTFLISFQY